LTNGYRLFNKLLKPWIKIRSPMLFLILWVGIYIIGFIGYYQVYFDQRKLTDILYMTCQLFLLRYDGPIPPPNNFIEFARFAAPVLMFSSAATLLLYTYFRGTAQQALLFFMKNHVIICGLGFIGPVIARKFLEIGFSVILIEKDPSESDIESWKKEGAIVIRGDASRPEILKLARIHKASYCIIATGDDSRNIGIATQIQAYYNIKRNSSNIRSRFINEDSIIDKLSNRIISLYNNLYLKHRNPLICNIHIIDHRLEHLLTSTKINLKSNEFFWDFFSIYRKAGEEAAKTWLESIHKNDTKTERLVLIIGAGRMGENLIVRIAKEWCTIFYKTNRKLHIKIIDYKGGKGNKLAQKYPWITTPCILSDSEVDVTETDFLSENFLSDKEKQTLAGIFICISHETNALIAGVRMQEILRKYLSNSSTYGKKIPIFIRTEKQEGVFSFINSLGTGKDNVNLVPFPILYDNSNLFSIISGPREKIAQKLYRDSQESCLSEDDWLHITEAGRQEFRYEANSFFSILFTLGHHIHSFAHCTEVLTSSTQLQDENKENTELLSNNKEIRSFIQQCIGSDGTPYMNGHIEAYWRNLDLTYQKKILSIINEYLKTTDLILEDYYE